MRWIRYVLFLILYGALAYGEPPTNAATKWPFEARVFIKFMLHGSNLGASEKEHSDSEKVKIFDEAIDYLRRYSALKPEVLSISSPAEANELFNRNLPDLYTFENEIEYLRQATVLPPVITDPKDTRSLQAAADYNHKQAELLQTYTKKIISTAGFLKHDSHGAMEAIFEVFSQQSSAVKSLLNHFQGSTAPVQLLHRLTSINLSDSAKLEIVNKFESGFNAALNELSTAAKTLSKPLPSERKFEERISKLMGTVVNTYFERLSERSKKEILSELVDSPWAITDLDRFRIVIRNTGPQFQKLIQAIAREPWIDPELKETLTLLENSGKAVPWKLLEPVLTAKPTNIDWLEIDQSPLGVGTVGQVHRTRARHKNKIKELAVKFIKPGSAERMEEDSHIFQAIADKIDQDPDFKEAELPQLRPLFEDISESNKIDMDLSHMEKMQRRARKTYSKTINVDTENLKGEIEFYVPKVIESTNPDVFISELVGGEKPEVLRKLHPTVEHEAAMSLLRTWLETALFESGYFHADLHQGNLLLELIEMKKEGEVTNFKLRVNIIDHGMNNSITKKQRHSFISLAFAVAAKDPGSISRILFSLRAKQKSDPTSENWNERVNEKERLLSQEGKEFDGADWFSWSSQQGLRFPFKFAGFNRGALTVSTLAVNSDEARSESTKVIIGLGLKHPKTLGQALLTGEQKIGVKGWGKLVYRACKGALSKLR